MGAAASWLVNYEFVDGWLKVASFLAITVPSATVIMAVDHFLLPRIFGISRPLTSVPSWAEAGRINTPAVLALFGAIVFGVTGTASWPGGWIYSSPPNGWGPVPVETWLIAGLGYIFCVAVVRGSRSLRTWLGFARDIPEEAVRGAVAPDVVTLAGAAGAPAGEAMDAVPL
jgi:hypothetical protein